MSATPLLLPAGLDPTQRAVTKMLVRRFGEPPRSALIAAALVVRQVALGHVCADLSTLLAEGSTASLLSPNAGAEKEEQALPSLKETLAALRSWPAVAIVDATDVDARRDDAQATGVQSSDSQSSEALPNGSALLLVGERLYLARYFDYESRLVRALTIRLQHPPQALDVAEARAALDRLFPDAGPAHDGQRLAAVAALRSSLSVIVGGPGTGKTTTVVRLLAALCELSSTPLRIQMVAPTGKASARLSEAVQRGIAGLDLSEETKSQIPTTASTIHRALGWRPSDPTRFRHSAANPLPVDVCVVDEASMVDIALMTKVVEAVPPSARLILLGDRDQLASVEAGAVLGDVAYVGNELPANSPEFAADVASWLSAAPELASSAESPAIRDAVVTLTHSWRFTSESGIGELASAIRRGDADASFRALDAFDDITLVTPGARRAGDLLSGSAHHWRRFAASTQPGEALESMRAVQVLCAHRDGAMGVRSWCKAVEAMLTREYEIRPSVGQYDHRAILVGANAPDTGLSNGDVGVVLQDDAGLAVWFDGVKEPRRLAVGRLPEHETVFAMTIHKSQGSEYEHVFVVLPNRISPIVTRELIYTGVTRAKSGVTIVADPNVLRAAIETPVSRASGLSGRLWAERDRS
jgi:exodeoxyribonuclease V alpha subunit